ncbi:charged multivesicular body protein 4b [Cryptotermes secundus]|uniref:charged multivesicular body protein 4b n=1 Tax=Cryptotermes secundus TaxID=105785 RepID=UPI001454C258|nr:charged multivesicular body protein 4b [Cryptotermes secundus]
MLCHYNCAYSCLCSVLFPCYVCCCGLQFLILFLRDVDQVHDMMDDIAEQQDVAKEISEAISNPVAFGQDVDEDELERELEELEQEELDKELLGVGPSVDELPSVPTTDIARPTPTKSKAKSRTEEEEDEYMKELQQWAS